MYIKKVSFRERERERDRERERVKGDIPQVAMDLQEGASVYDYGMLAMC